MRILSLEDALGFIDIKYIYANGDAIAIITKDFDEKFEIIKKKNEK